jgi:hypothetical protein
MKMYHKSPALAVAEWRNLLQTCSDAQLLPLLYVANEVIQTSKRNRGNNYLESFSPILGASLRIICERDPSVTEKVRRTAKIWGDRKIFSTRYVGELLAGVENFRQSSNSASMSMNMNAGTGTSTSMQRKPVHEPVGRIQPPQQQFSDNKHNSYNNDDNNANDNDSIQFDDDMQNDNIDDDDDDEDMFGNSGPSLLDLPDFNVDKQALQREASRTSHGVKRRRSSLLSNNEKGSGKKSSTLSSTYNDDGDNNNNNDNNNNHLNKKLKGQSSSTTKKSPKRKSTLSTSSLNQLVDQLSNLDSESKSISRQLSSIQSSELCTSTDEVNEVGDELIELHTEVNTMTDDVKKHGKNLWRVADRKRNIELEFKRYLVWMKAGLDIDKEEIQFCDDLEKKLKLLRLVHGTSKLFFYFILSFFVKE